MKNIEHINVIILLLLLSYCKYGFSQWQEFQTTYNTTFIDVSVVNSNIIWACGSNSQLSVVRTNNGGLNWVNALSGSSITHVWHISAIDENHAWVTGGLYDKYVFATTNGGLNWVQQNYYPSEFINFIHFFNINTGIFLTDKVNDTIGFFITRNGGLNWYRSVNSPIITTIIIDNCMGLLDSNLIWFLDDDKFYKLTGGLDNSWVSYNMGFYPYNVDFKNITTGFATDGYMIKKTSNGGVNWQLLMDTVLGQYSNSFIIVPNSDMAVVTSSNRVRISYDLCSSWQSIKYFNHGHYIDAIDTNNIWLTGTSGIMYKYNFNYIGIKNNQHFIADNFVLYNNYPNPFNPSTLIKFDVPKNSFVKLFVYDLLGREMETLVNEELNAGEYSVDWEASNYTSGVYFYKLIAEDFSDTKKMILLK